MNQLLLPFDTESDTDPETGLWRGRPIGWRSPADHIWPVSREPIGPPWQLVTTTSHASVGRVVVRPVGDGRWAWRSLAIDRRWGYERDRWRASVAGLEYNRTLAHGGHGHYEICGWGWSRQLPADMAHMRPALLPLEEPLP